MGSSRRWSEFPWQISGSCDGLDRDGVVDDDDDDDDDEALVCHVDADVDGSVLIFPLLWHLYVDMGPARTGTIHQLGRNQCKWCFPPYPLYKVAFLHPTIV